MKNAKQAILRLESVLGVLEDNSTTASAVKLAAELAGGYTALATLTKTRRTNVALWAKGAVQPTARNIRAIVTYLKSQDGGA